MGREKPDAREDEADHAETNGKPGQRDCACNHRRGRQHDGNLEGGGRNLIVVVLGRYRVALLLCRLRSGD